MFAVERNNTYPPQDFYSRHSNIVDTVVSLIAHTSYVCVYAQDNPMPIILVWNTYTKGIKISLIDENYNDLYYKVRRAIDALNKG